MASINTKTFVLLLITALFLSRVCSSINNGGITLDLIHRDDAFNTSNNNNRFANLRSAFRRSFARQRALSNSIIPSSPDPNNFDATVSYGNGDYIMKFKIGTPPVQISAFADTGSDVTWTQCTPCVHCFDQPDPLFDPTQSSSYSRVPCTGSDILCSSCDEEGFCSYQITYGDSAYSRGDSASETFTFDSDSSGDQSSLSIPNVVFGCGRDNAGDYGGTASGMVGLGGGSASIIRQLDAYVNGRFSYCLTSRAQPTATSKISFGNNAVVSGPGVVSTPLYTQPGVFATFYYVALKGISVGDETIMIDRSSSSINKDGTAVKEDRDNNNNNNGVVGVIVDSGTSLTFVPRDLYDSVESAAAGYITGTRVSDPDGMFGLCYDTSSGGIDTPKVVIHFEGADLALPDNGIFAKVTAGMRCLGLVVAAENRPYVFGNLLQMNYHVGFDLKEMTVSFLPTDCSQPQ